MHALLTTGRGSDDFTCAALQFMRLVVSRTCKTIYEALLGGLNAAIRTMGPHWQPARCHKHEQGTLVLPGSSYRQSTMGRQHTLSRLLPAQHMHKRHF